MGGKKSKEAIKRWNKSEKGRAATARYRATLKARQAKSKRAGSKYLHKRGMCERNIYAVMARLDQQMLGE